MTKEELIEWVNNLPLQTLTDELKADIVDELDAMLAFNVSDMEKAFIAGGKMARNINAPGFHEFLKTIAP
jgi:hypothetical protein